MQIPVPVIMDSRCVCSDWDPISISLASSPSQFICNLLAHNNPNSYLCYNNCKICMMKIWPAKYSKPCDNLICYTTPNLIKNATLFITFGVMIVGVAPDA